MGPKVTEILLLISRRKDLMIMLMVMIGIGMMIFPIPEIMLDFILAINITASTSILITAFYLKSAAQLTTFPSLLLVTTLMRLAASIASTRMILLYGDAGEIIKAFGSFVVGGNLVVGIVIFLIITVVNFLVITKGSERVAEVSARFTLDAMPGKQMSIDAELKSGDIDKVEAQRRREELSTESQFFGAMDGAMKFVKGDAIAGIVILFINIIGGLITGTTYMGMSAGEATEVFTILSIGDGLVAQIPSILISIASGMVITRITDSKSKDLGADIIRELLQSDNTNRILAFSLFAIAFVPGFPTAVFMTLSVVFFLLSYHPQIRTFYHHKIKNNLDYKPPVPVSQDDLHEKIPPGSAKIEVIMGQSLMESIEHDVFLRGLKMIRKQLIAEYGINIPYITAIRAQKIMKENFFTIDLDGIPIAEGELQKGYVIAECDYEILQVAEIPCEMTAPMVGGSQRAFLVEDSYIDALRDAGIPFLNAQDRLLKVVGETLRSNLGSFMSLQEVQDWINDAARGFPDLVNEIRQAIQPAKAAEVFKRLLSDHISLASRRPLLEALANWISREEDPAMLAELIRVSLRRQICFSYANEDKVIVAAIFDPAVEETIRQSVRRTNLGDFLSLEEPMTEKVLSAMHVIAREPRFMRPMPVILAAIDIRRFIRSFLVKHGFDIPILSHQDIAEDFTVQVIYSIK